MKKNVLFLCTGNSCRSQIAEGWGKSIKSDQFNFYSAGTKKHGLNPNAIIVMKEVGIDISTHESNTTDELPDVKMDFVFTVCSDAHENCPFFSGGKIIHVGFDDPPRLTRDMTDEEDVLNVYRRVRDEIKEMIIKIEKYIDGRMGLFERYLSIWVALCIVGGIVLGKMMGSSISVLSEMNIATVNVPVAILVWLMIFPMMVQIDFSSIKNVGRNPKGLALTLIINWIVKPFSMALFAWIFFNKIYSAYLSPELASQYIAGAILLGAAPCTAMVFVWSYLTKGDPEYTLVQVAINDLVLLVAFIPIVKFLLGVTNITIPYTTLISSVVIFVVIPLLAGYICNKLFIKSYGIEWFKNVFMEKLKPISILALLSTLILLFAFQGEKIISSPFNILLIAIPLTIQTYFIFFVAWGIGKKMKIPHCILSPGSMIGASNFFELAVAVAIALFGLNSGAALVTVVGVLIEVPVMLSLVKISNKWRY